MALLMRSRSFSETLVGSLRALETVMELTPARAATSDIVVRPEFFLVLSGLVPIDGVTIQFGMFKHCYVDFMLALT